MIGISNVFGKYGVTNLPKVELIGTPSGTPSFSYSYTVPSNGFYIALVQVGDSGGSIACSDGEITLLTGSETRHTLVGVIAAPAGATITLTGNNRSGSTNCFTSGLLAKISQPISITDMVSQPYNRDSSYTHSYVMSDNLFLVVHGQCGNASTCGNNGGIAGAGEYEISEVHYDSGLYHMYCGFVKVVEGTITQTFSGSVGTAGGA